MPRKQKDLTVNLAMVANVRGLNQALNLGARHIGDFTKSSNRSFADLARSASISFGVVTAGLAAATAQVVNAADQIAKSAKALGFQAEQYQKLVFAIERVGGDLAAIERGILRFQKQLAGVGDQEGVKVFENLGLSVSEFRKLAPEEGFQKITIALSKLDDVTQRNALTMDLFGTRGSKAINLLVNDMVAYRKELERAENIGAIFADVTLENAQETKDAFGDLIAVVERGFADGALKNSIERTEELDIVLRSVGDTFEFIAEHSIGLFITATNKAVNVLADLHREIQEVRSSALQSGGSIEILGTEIDTGSTRASYQEFYRGLIGEIENYKDELEDAIEIERSFRSKLQEGANFFSQDRLALALERRLQIQERLNEAVTEQNNELAKVRNEQANIPAFFDGNTPDTVGVRVSELQEELKLLGLSNQQREIEVRLQREVAKGLSAADGRLRERITLNVEYERSLEEQAKAQEQSIRLIERYSNELQKQEDAVKSLFDQSRENLETFDLSDRELALKNIETTIQELRDSGTRFNAEMEAWTAQTIENTNSLYDSIDALNARNAANRASADIARENIRSQEESVRATVAEAQSLSETVVSLENKRKALGLSGEALIIHNTLTRYAGSVSRALVEEILQLELAIYRETRATEAMVKAKEAEAEALNRALDAWGDYADIYDQQRQDFITGEAQKIVALNEFADALEKQNRLLQLEGVDRELEKARQQYGNLTVEVEGLIRANYELANASKTAVAELSYQAEQMQKIWDNMVQSMQRSFEDVIYSTLWEDGIDSFKDFGDAILNTWKRVVAQMVAAWATSGITRILQGGGIGGGLLGAGSALASNGGGGVLSGLLGNFGGGGSGGGILNSLGSSFRSLGGLFGGGGGALAGFYSGAGATAAIGGSALGGATGAATAGGLAGSIGAALPAIGAVALAFSFFSSKTKELDNGIRITIDNMDVLAESYRRVQKSRFFGLSKKTREYYDEASDEITALFQEGIDTVSDSVGSVFNIFGLATDSLDDFSAQFKVSLKDLSDTERTQAIEDALRDIANQMTNAAFSANGLNLTLEQSEMAMERLALAGELVVAAAERADAINEGRLDGLGAFQSQIENLTTQGLSDVLDEVGLELDTELSNEFERFVREINTYLGTDSDNQITSLQQAADEIQSRIEDATRNLEREREAVLNITDDIERGAREFQVAQDSATLEGLRNLFDEVVKQLESVGGREFETLTTLSQAISDEFDQRGQQRIETGLITRLLDRADVVVAGINDLAEAASDATNQAFDFITGLINSAGGHVSQQTETLTNALITSIERYISTVTSASHLVNNYGSGIVDDLANDVKNARQALSDAVPSVTQSIVETVNEVVQQVRDTSDRGGDGPSGGVGGPGFATGGIVPGARGEPMLAVVHGGEEILTPMQRGRGGDPINITINVQGDADTMVVRAIERHVRDVASMIGSVR